MAGNKTEQKKSYTVTIVVSEELFDKIEEQRNSQGRTRNNFLNVVLSKALLDKV